MTNKVDEPWRCEYCDTGYPCLCRMDAEYARLDALDQEYFEEDMAMTDYDIPVSPYEDLDELYEDAPKFQKIQRSQTPVSDGHNLQRVTENARNRQLKAARKLKELTRETPND